jgi:hypothetical protein
MVTQSGDGDGLILFSGKEKLDRLLVLWLPRPASVESSELLTAPAESYTVDAHQMSFLFAHRPQAGFGLPLESTP